VPGHLKTRVRRSGEPDEVCPRTGADAVRGAIEELRGATAAAGKIAGVKAVQEVLARILDGGPTHALGMPGRPRLLSVAVQRTGR
jgi:hypothetical protein